MIKNHKKLDTYVVQANWTNNYEGEKNHRIYRQKGVHYKLFLHKFD